MLTTKRKPASVGEILMLEFMAPMGLTQGALAKAMGVQRKHVNELCNDRRKVTAPTAAPWLQPGWNGQITLEIRNSGPFHIELIPTEDMPCQVTFFKLTSGLTDAVAYGSRPTDVFQNQANPLPVKE
jgi:hypothetical protein